MREIVDENYEIQCLQGCDIGYFGARSGDVARAPGSTGAPLGLPSDVSEGLPFIAARPSIDSVSNKSIKLEHWETLTCV